MSIRITAGSIVVRLDVLERFEGGEGFATPRGATSISSDGRIVAFTFRGESEAREWIARLRSAATDFAVFDAAADLAEACEWLWLERDGEGAIAWLASAERGDVAAVSLLEHAPFERLEVLSTSPSGLHFVRDRKSGVLRQLTDEELNDFSDPPPCHECGEQFGCEHFNCAGEPLLTDHEIAAAVPPEWIAFARDYGISRSDLDRLRWVQTSEGEYRLAAGAPTDVRTLELVLLLNESR